MTADRTVTPLPADRCVVRGLFAEENHRSVPAAVVGTPILSDLANLPRVEALDVLIAQPKLDAPAREFSHADLRRLPVTRCRVAGAEVRHASESAPTRERNALERTGRLPAVRTQDEVRAARPPLFQVDDDVVDATILCGSQHPRSRVDCLRPDGHRPPHCHVDLTSLDAMPIVTWRDRRDPW